MTSQREFDYARARQFELIRNAVLPAVEIREGHRRVSVKPHALKGVLNVIDRHAGKSGTCWASYASLATETGLSTNSVERAIKALRQLGILTITREPVPNGFRYHRRIVFSNLVDYHPELRAEEVREEQRAESSFLPPEALPTEGEALPTEPEALPTEGGGTPHTEGKHSPPVGSKVHEAIEVHLRSSTREARGEPRGGGTGVFDQQGGTDQKQPAALPLIPNLDPDALEQPEMIQALYDLASERGSYQASEQHRMAWFAWCHRLQVWRRSQIRKGREPPNVIGFLHRVLANGPANAMREAWKMHTHQDEEWARKAIREFDLVDHA